MLAKRIEEKLESPFNLSGHEVFTTTSIGIAMSSAGYDHPEGILRDADTAMYRAKAQGKACYEVFDKGMHARAVYLLQMETDCGAHSTAKNSVSTISRSFRWKMVSLPVSKRLFVGNTGTGLCESGDFISLAEDTGLITLSACGS
jgi:predicted signal transduction protein with EAL and GGDEF domain